MSKNTFYRQSAWMMIATIAQGALMWAVHLLSKYIPDSEYGTFGTLLSLSMLVPVLPLQMVFAQQTAAALATGRQAQLARMLRMAWVGTFVVWLLAVVVMHFFQGYLIDRWNLSNPLAIWVVLAGWLGCIWTPIFWGAMQGKQDFLWMGWSMIFNGIGRLGCAAVFVLVLGGYATGMMAAVAIGYGLAICVGIWATRDLWMGRGEPFAVGAILKQIIPLLLGFGACQFLFTSDTMFVKAWFPGDPTAFYVAAGTLSRGVIWLVMPLVAVMFPKIVHSTARSEKTDVMAITLLGTAVLAMAGAVGLWVVGPLVVRLVFKPSYVEVATSLLPWYAGAMIPLSLANVLVNNLLARSQFKVVPWLIALAVAYPVALNYFHGSMIAVLQTLAAFCTILLAISAWFTWGQKGHLPPPSESLVPGAYGRVTSDR